MRAAAYQLSAEPPPRCSFCGRARDCVEHLVEGAAGVRICDVCIGECHGMLGARPAAEAEPISDVALVRHGRALAALRDIARWSLDSHSRAAAAEIVGEQGYNGPSDDPGTAVKVELFIDGRPATAAEVWPHIAAAMAASHSRRNTA